MAKTGAGCCHASTTTTRDVPHDAVTGGGADRLLPGQGADQDQQRGAGSVEVGEELIHRPEAVAGVGEQSVEAGPQGGAFPRRLQGPHHAGADRHHRPAVATCRCHRQRRWPRHREAFPRRVVWSSARVARIGVKVPAPTCSVTRATHHGHSPLLQEQQTRREVQAGGGGGAGSGGAHRLVAFVVVVGGAVDVGGSGTAPCRSR